ncbi:MAG: ABC transporter permease [Acidobacteriota bacterium]
MDKFFQDVRYAVRMMLKKPGFAFVAVTVLALGIGANTSIFSVVNSVLLRPLPYENPDQLVVIKSTLPTRGITDSGISTPDFREWRNRNTTFQQMAAFSTTSYNLSGSGEPERVSGARVSSNLFSLLGIAPALGRAFTSEEETFGNHRVALISHALWQRRFAADRSVIDQSVTINGEHFTIIGVLPRGFSYPNRSVDVWTPLSIEPGSENDTRGNYWLSVISRLKPGVPIAQARSEMTSIAEKIDEETEGIDGMGASVTSLREETVGQVETVLWVLLAAVGFVLAVACANVANLMLARSAARQKEMAIRLSMGATRPQIIRQLLTESLLMGMAGGVIGILIAIWGVDLLVSLSPQDLPRIGEIRPDTTVFAFTLVVSIITGAIFGIVPAVNASRTDINSLLKEGARGSSAARSSLMRNTIVALEVAVSLVLLVGAGLMINSFYRLTRVDPGFKTERTLTMLISLPRARYPEAKPELTAGFFDHLITRARALPGVESVGATTSMPLTNSGWGKLFWVEGRPRPASIEEVPIIQYSQVSVDYFQTISVPLVKGRYFDEKDGRDTARVAIINEALANQVFGEEDPLGKLIFPGVPEEMIPPGLFPTGFRFPRFTVVGVVRDVQKNGIASQVRPEMYTLHIQGAQNTANAMYLAVRTSGDPMSIVGAIRSQVTSLDKEQAISEVATMDQLLANSLAQSRFTALLLGIFASVALLLATVGIYGVISYSVAGRTHEIGIRMALGAASGNILRMIIGQGMATVSIGVGLGLAGAFAVTRLMESLLYEVTATDPFTFGAITLLLCGVALAACYIPARRAMRVAPTVALRYE